MVNQKAISTIAIQPFGLRRGLAAQMCGVSPATFDRLVHEDVFPQPRNAGGIKLWLRSDLEQALLELDSPEAKEGSSCDAVFKA